MRIYIYALVDPTSHLVRYVGQAADLQQRYRSHCAGYESNTTSAWVKSLHQPPILVILETIEDADKRRHFRGVRNEHGVRICTVAETKWIKRFRRTLLNKNQRLNSAATWDWLINPDEERKRRVL